jgi:hypothetical protein
MLGREEQLPSCLFRQLIGSSIYIVTLSGTGRKCLSYADGLTEIATIEPYRPIVMETQEIVNGLL